MHSLFSRTSLSVLVAAGGLALSAPALATEGGGSAYPNGAENWAAGAAPPAGVFYVNYSNYYSADTLTDNNGDALPIDFELTALANVSRVIWNTGIKILGADYLLHTLIPLVDLDVAVAGTSDHNSGLGDITVSPLLLAWHTPTLHVVAGSDVILPTGDYDKTQLANLGRNYYTVEPLVAVSYLSANGVDLSLKMMLDINMENDATGYTSGNEFHADFLAGKKMGNFWLGVGGYYYQQLTDDEVDGQTVQPDGYRGSVLALGPSLRYDIGGKLPVMLSWQSELQTENRTEGDKLWLKFVLPLKID